MHRVAEYGIAAHWRYKEPGKPDEPEDMQRFAWLRQMLEWQQQLQDPQEFLRSVKEDLFTEDVFVFTPNGDLLNFPVGATVIDFAYRIHSEVGHHCAGARVNGKIVPLRYQLQSGDTVEIVTTANQAPSKDWLKLVKSSRAKARIRAYIKAQQSSRSIAVGREILERDLGRHQLDYAKLRSDGTLKRVAQELHEKDEDALLASLGYGKVTAQQALARSCRRRRSSAGAREEGRLQRLFRLVSRQATGACRSRASRTSSSGSGSAAARCRASASPASSRAGAA
jgi:GTP pyrophosphokinase